MESHHLISGTGVLHSSAPEAGPWECLRIMASPYLEHSVFLWLLWHVLCKNIIFLSPDTRESEDLVTINKEDPFWIDWPPATFLVAGLTGFSVWIAFGPGIFFVPGGPEQDCKADFIQHAGHYPK